MSAAAGSNGKQGSGFMSVISFWTGKSKGERKSSGRSRSSQDTLPRSYGMNRTSSERAERPKPVDMGRRNSDSGLQQPDDDHLVGRVDDDDAATRDPEARSESLAPKATVGMEGAAAAGAATTTEATATTAAMTTAETATTTRATATASATGSATASAAAEEQTDLELGFPAVYIINYWKQKEERKFATRMADMNEPPMDYAPVSPARLLELLITHYYSLCRVLNLFDNQHRRYMVDWISEVGEQLDLQTVTIHSAVSFLDELMILMNYSHRDWRLYAVCCLSVAAKYEEAECNMPMISELAEATELSLNTPIVTRGELELVQKLEWDVSRVTAMHFLGYYTSQVIVYMKKYVDFFANLCQQDYRFQRYRPSHIAAAAILAARRALCIMPVWRDELTALTGYTLADIVECGEELWNVYEKMFPTHKPLRTDPNAAAKKKAEQADAAAAAAYAAAASGVRSRASAAGAAPSNGSDSRVVAANRNRANGADGRAHGKSGSGSSSTANLRARSS